MTLAVTQYSSQLSSGAFGVAEIGRTVILDGDPAWNQVIGTANLLNPYMGASGTVNGLVYGDAYYSTRYPFDRIIGNPAFANQTMGALISTTMTRGNFNPGVWFNQTFGQPQTWWTQNMGNAEGNNPVLVMRFSPAPQTAYSMNVRLGFWPKQFTIADLTTATDIPVPDQFLNTCFFPLAVRALMSMPVFDRSWQDPTVVYAAAEKAEAFLDSQPAQQAPSNRVFTPVGY